MPIRYLRAIQFIGLIIGLALCFVSNDSVFAKTIAPSIRRQVSSGQGKPLGKGLIKVPYRAWLPEQKGASIVLLCVHGLGFSSQAFNQFGNYMAARGIPTYALDVRGFGQWVKMQGHETVDFESCLSDVEQALRTLHKTYPKARIFLVGESMGGAIALRVTSRFPELVDGLISAVPSSDRFAKTKSELIVGMHLIDDPNKPMGCGTDCGEALH